MGWMLAAYLALSTAAGPDLEALFPAELAGWTRTRAVETYDPKTVFDYMDGHAEIFLTYRFQRIWVGFYRRGEQHATVEVYDMGEPAEAFGIWSNDLEGDPVEGMQEARYLGGILRGWQGRYFGQVQGEAETPEVAALCRQAAPHLGRQLGPAGPPPKLLGTLPREPLALNRLRYFHRDSNLNSFYYIHTLNVLALDGTTRGAFADGVLGGAAVKVCVIEYPAKEPCERGWQGYCTRVMSKSAHAVSAGERCETMAADKWTGVRKMRGPRGQFRLAFCFDAATEALCRRGLALLADQSHRE
ncbi:MAG: hypothetical protein HYU66_19090 [Armatimonadetes bacterium]|nr:hypothetical protein [Armatimonadota bacterium]